MTSIASIGGLQMRDGFNGWRRVFACGLVAFTAMLSALMQAQGGSATLSGKVLDPDSKLVVGAAIILRNEATNEIRTVTTDNVGRFTVSGLTTGTYTIEVA